jgi:single-stranded-DNA-specific exonuclease
MPDLESAARRLHNAIAKHESILVWGDFDVDGQTSTALLVSVLRGLGADPGFHIPVRALESHGSTCPPQAGAGADVQVLLTCDTGITAHPRWISPAAGAWM